MKHSGSRTALAACLVAALLGLGCAQTGLVRVAYNGRAELVVANDLTFVSFNSRALDQIAEFGSFGINLRYYF